MRTIVIAVVAALGLVAVRGAAAQNCMYGCCVRPACGKVCKLVCETTKLTAVGYGSECKDICVPGPSRPGCKRCYVTCCADGECCPDCDCPCGGCGCKECVDQRPRIEFCWYDWFACGCARPRTVRLLTKYQAEKEVCSYHWEVVDACECDCCPTEYDDCAAGGTGNAECQCVYKPAPLESNIGDVFELTSEDRAELVPAIVGTPDAKTPAAEAEAAEAKVETAPGADVKPATAETDPAEAKEPSLLRPLRDAFRFATES